MLREGDLATSFGLQNNEIAKLRFLDSSETLYLVRSRRHSETVISSEVANRELGKPLLIKNKPLQLSLKYIKLGYLQI